MRFYSKLRVVYWAQKPVSIYSEGDPRREQEAVMDVADDLHRELSLILPDQLGRFGAAYKEVLSNVRRTGRGR